MVLVREVQYTKLDGGVIGASSFILPCICVEYTTTTTLMSDLQRNTRTFYFIVDNFIPTIVSIFTQ